MVDGATNPPARSILGCLATDGRVSRLARAWKPWLLWQPRRALGRLVRGATSHAGYEPLELAWGGTILADPSRAIGHSIATTGTHDLAVSEVFARVIDPGDRVVDAGANIGYMTRLAALAAGPSGTVIAFEPHPQLFAVLERNVAGATPGTARTMTRNVALGERAGHATLVVPPTFAGNDGVAHVEQRGGDGGIVVPMETLDATLGTLEVGVLKLDVEGSELAVLAGAGAALEARRIRHVLFEDHVGAGSDVMRMLVASGYTVYAIGWSMLGPRLGTHDRRLAKPYESQSYLATLVPDEVRRRCARRGWLVYRRGLGRRAAISRRAASSP